MILEGVFDYLTAHFTASTYRTYWPFLLSALLLAFSVYVSQAKRDWSISGAFKFIFPKEVWWHHSSRLDYAYFVVNAIVMLLLFTPLIVWVYPATTEGLLALLSLSGLPAFNAPPAGMAVLYFLAFVLVTDFMIFLGHYLQHKVPFLWQFHKVHHAAEVLNPITLYRQHPLDFILVGILVGAGSASVHALFAHIFSQPFTLLTVGGLNALAFVFYMFGYNLRHSHIRLSFGKTADEWLISPEQHQLHHSCVEAHFDKNMGLIFAVWDRLFNTHYIPQKDEEIILGLPDGEAEEFNSVYQCYILPFKKAFKSNKLALASLLFAGIGGSTAALAVGSYAPPSLHLEELTWTEVEQAKQVGFTSVIIPTGGTEQNGPHVILGKHNKIIKYTSEEIARRHGKTLIAPVMAYVPEGSISPKTGHMLYTGTLTIREDAFEMILEDTAKSLFAHGFTDVFIIGDSGDSVNAQERAVKKVKSDLSQGQSILHVTDYYNANKQVEYLLEQGFTREAIGYHAGMRDTSELMSVAPEGIRDAPRLRTTQDKGANGAFWKASDDIGEVMLRLKIDAALAQMTEEPIVEVATR